MTVLGSLGVAPQAHASNYGVELNGTWKVMSNGQWAKTNSVFIDQKTDIQIWNITSSCVSPIECTGTVTSDKGWTAPINLVKVYWILNREIPDWAPCPDGTFAHGRQKFTVWGINPALNERDLFITDLLAGRNITETDSGACGRNQPIDIELPVRMERIA
ncbi:hypothetical protein CQY20_02670 [Mycolicibacterium agri]|nr:hypothetical protein CQY20_02670 [Mycolicibacterium agri]